MKKRFVALALCLSMVMPNYAYSMEDFADNPQLRRRVLGTQPQRENQSQEAEPAVIHAAQHFRLSDLNPYYWSVESKALALWGTLFIFVLGRFVHKNFLYVPEGSVMGCRPGIDFKLRNTEDKQIIFTEALENATHIVCRGVLHVMGYPVQPINLTREKKFWDW